MRSWLVVALAGSLVVGGLFVGCPGPGGGVPGPSPSPTVSGPGLECSTIGHEHLVLASALPAVSSPEIVEAFTTGELASLAGVASRFAAVTSGFDDAPAVALADAAARYAAVLRVAAVEAATNGRVSPVTAAAVYERRIEVREDYRVFANVTCAAGTSGLSLRRAALTRDTFNYRVRPVV